jgi:hypothetical protein
VLTPILRPLRKRFTFTGATVTQILLDQNELVFLWREISSCDALQMLGCPAYKKLSVFTIMISRQSNQDHEPTLYLSDVLLDKEYVIEHDHTIIKNLLRPWRSSWE